MEKNGLKHMSLMYSVEQEGGESWASTMGSYSKQKQKFIKY